MDGWIPTHTIGRLSCPVLFYVGSFSFTPHAASCGDILLHTLCWFMWGLSILCGDIITCLSCCFTCGVFLKFLMLFYVGSFSDTPDAVLRGEFLLHTPCYLMWEDSLTCRILFYVVSFFDITHTGCFLFSFFLLSGKCLLDSACCFMWWFLLHYSCFFIEEVYFPCPTIFDIRNFSCTSYASWCGDILLHTLCWFMWGLSILCGDIITCLSCCFTCGVFLKFLMLFYVGSFSDTPDAVLRGEFLLHTPCYLMWEDSLTCRILFYVVSFFDITHTGCFLFSFFLLSGKCLLDSACCFMWWFLLHYSCFFIQEVYFPCPTIFDIRNFSCTSYASLCGDIFK